MPRLVLEIDMKDVEDNVNRMLRKKIKSIYYQRSIDDIAMAYKDAIEKYVPLKSGLLRDNATVDSGAVIYSAKAKRPGGNYDYAAYQYYNEFSKRTTPNTYGHWNTHLTTEELRAFYDEVKDIIVERMNDE